MAERSAQALVRANHSSILSPPSKRMANTYRTVVQILPKSIALIQFGMPVLGLEHVVV